MMRLALFIALVGCTGGSTALSTGTTATEPAPVTKACADLPTDGFTLGSAMTVDSEARVLRVSVSYGGGCEDHLFAACWDGGVSKSNPATFTLSLHHDANDDLCDAFITRDLFIDLSATPEGFGAPQRASETSIELTEQL